jgi:hypothetical protein
MRKRKTRTEAFKRLAVTLRNPRNAWSGRNEDLPRVVVTAWTDYFDHSGSEYRFKPLTDENKAGRKWLIDDVQYAIDHCNCIVHLVLAEAKSTTEIPRKIARCEAVLHMVLEITEFDPITAGFTARVIYRPVEPISPTTRLAA